MLSASVLLSLLATGVFAQDSSAAVGTTTAPASSVTQAIPASSGVQAGSVNPNLPQTPLASVAGYTVPYVIPFDPSVSLYITSHKNRADNRPLSALTSGAATAQTIPLSTTETAGTQPTAVSGAPALPAPTLTIANYPALDTLPPTNSSEVQEWLSKVGPSVSRALLILDRLLKGS